MRFTTMYISISNDDKGLMKFPCIYRWQLCVQSSIDIASVAKTYASFQFGDHCCRMVFICQFQYQKGNNVFLDMQKTINEVATLSPLRS